MYCGVTHLLLPSSLTQKLLIIQASYYRISKLRTHITQKPKKLNICKCRIVPGFCRSGHIYDYTLCTSVDIKVNECAHSRGCGLAMHSNNFKHVFAMKFHSPDHFHLIVL